MSEFKPDLNPKAEDQARPEPFDDAPPAESVSQVEPERREARDDKPREKPELLGENPIRNDIVEQYRQKRALEEGLPPIEGALPDDGGDDELQDPDARPVAGPSASAAPIADDPELELIVFGERYKAKKSELAKRYNISGADDATIIRIAQKELAADQRLSQTRTAPQPAPENHREPEPTPAPTKAAPAKTTLDDDKLAEITSKLQVGDTEEGKAALREVIDGAVATAVEQVRAEVPTMLEASNTQRTHLDEINRAVAKFGEENSDIVSNPDLRTVVLDVSARKMREAMADLGVRQDVLAAMGNNRQVADAYHGYRRQGYNLKPTGELLTDVGEHIRSTFGLPKPSVAPAPGSPTPSQTAIEAQARERQQRKAAAPQQPRHGGTRAEAPTAPRPKTPQEIVSDMRGARNFR